MICISINQESRRLALVDMINSARQCDLLEIRLDRFGMAPELGEILSRKPTPVIMSCRRRQEGGHWDGSEAERLALLRQCIVQKADYVEIEVDVADQIQRFPPTKRVISCYIKPDDSAQDIVARYTEAQSKDPDVIKLTSEVRTPEEAWPFVQILSKPPVPTVVVGLGKSGVMLAALAKKVDSPWSYAALEKGMEAYPGQPSVHELKTVYHFDKIGRKTRLVGVTGFGNREYLTVAGLNAALAHLGLGARCLPLGVGSARLFSKVIDAVKLAGVVIDYNHQRMLCSLAAEQHPSAKFAGAVDLLVEKGEHWQGYYSTPQAAVNALAHVLKGRSKADDPLASRMALLIGMNPVARTIAADLQHRGASVILASHDKKAAQQAAHELGCRFVQLEAVYTTLHDTLIFCDAEKDDRARGDAGDLNVGVIRSGSTVMDLTADARRTELLLEAQKRDAHIVRPRDVLIGQLQLQTKLLSGQDVPADVFAGAFPDWVLDEE
jgi:3-dehydroquinate dehydratase/shikimate dehydrogenase